ncbi:MAG: acyltransferase [Bacteroidales bacterium]
MTNINVLLTYLNCKTIFFNFHYLPFKVAARLPIFLSRNTKLKRMKGSVRISGPIKPGMIRIGTNEIGIYDKRFNRPVWENLGVVDFRGTALIKYGARIIIGEGAKLVLGNHFRISSGSSIICFKSIEFGHNCAISWDSQIIDTDFHKVYDENSSYINPDREIRIGNDCWIGNHSIIQKGTTLGNMVVVASNSMLNSGIPDNNVILGGSPAKIIKTSVTWTH